MSAVEDLPAKPPLADDPRFLDSLNDLDRGLTLDVPPPTQTAPTATPPGPPAPRRGQASAATARRAAPVTPPAEPASPPPNPIGAPELPPGRRPLLDLFPPVTRDGGPPGPMPGTAVGPRLTAETPRRRPAPDATVAAPPPPATYETFYGLRERPFGVSTDPKYFFAGLEPERVARTLLTAIRGREAATLLTGELGIGKTTVCRAALRQLDRHTVSSLVAGPAASVDDLLKTMLVDFGVVARDEISAAAVSRESLVATLRSFVDSLAPLRAGAVVVVDEAQQQPVEVLEELGRLIARREAAASLQVVLVGPPPLAARLADRPQLRALNEAIGARVELGPLAHDDIAGYVAHRLSVAGAGPRARFDADALDRIFELSRGVPGVVNLLCDRALTAGFERSATTIDASIVDGAASALNDGAPRAEPRSSVNLAVAAALVALFTLAGAAAAVWVFRDAVARTLYLWQNVPAPPRAPLILKPAPLRALPPPADASDPPTDNPAPPPRV
jgi:type II secretory pathway predicted ATPase ExeA